MDLYFHCYCCLPVSFQEKFISSVLRAESIESFDRSSLVVTTLLVMITNDTENNVVYNVYYVNVVNFF